MSRLNFFLLLLVISAIEIDGRALRERRGIWPDVLAPGGNTFAASGYYNMHTNIAYPESGFAYNPNVQGWNPYWQGYYQQNQFNNYNPYDYNQLYPYAGSGQGILNPGLGMNNGFPYNDQGNYNGYYPSGTGDPWYPPGANIGVPPRSGIANSRSAGNIGGLNPMQRSRRLAPSPSNPTNI